MFGTSSDYEFWGEERARSKYEYSCLHPYHNLQEPRRGYKGLKAFYLWGNTRLTETRSLKHLHLMHSIFFRFPRAVLKRLITTFRMPSGMCYITCHRHVDVTVSEQFLETFRQQEASCAMAQIVKTISE